MRLSAMSSSLPTVNSILIPVRIRKPPNTNSTHSNSATIDVPKPITIARITTTPRMP